MNTLPVWLLFGWSRRFELWRGCWLLLMTGPVTWACAHYISGLLSLLVMAVSAWPFPYRARWTPEGLDVRWLFVKDRVRLQNIERARLRTRFRHQWLFRYKLALELEIVRGRRAVVIAEPPILEHLYQQITTALTSRDRQSALLAAPR